MNCPNCGHQIPEDNYICPNCGYSLQEEYNEEYENNSSSGKTSNLLSKGIFYVVSILLLIIFIISIFMAIVFDSRISAIIAFVQAVTMIVVLLAKKYLKEMIQVILIFICCVLIIPYSLNFNGLNDINWSDIVLAQYLPKPSNLDGYIYSNTDSRLDLDIDKISSKEFYNYKNECISDGYTIESKSGENSYVAYNEEGYKIDLYYYSSSNSLSINLEAPISLNNVVWPSNELTNLIPSIDHTKTKILNNDDKMFSAYIGDVSLSQYNNYVTKCSNAGFNIKPKAESKTYSAKNSNNNVLTLEYVGNSIIKVSMEEPKYTIKTTIKYSGKKNSSNYISIRVDDEYIKSVYRGETISENLDLSIGSHVITFRDYKNDLESSKTINVTGESSISYTLKVANNDIVIK